MSSSTATPTPKGTGPRAPGEATGRLRPAGVTAARRATIVDVAAAAGVSRQTVSNVVNAPERVATSTRARVETQVARLGYQPHRAAQALRRRQPRALGIQVNSIGERRLGNVLDPFLVELTMAARRHDVSVVTFAVESPDDPTADYARLMARQVVDGFVLTNTRQGDPRPPWLRSHGVSFVAFGRVWDDPAFTSWVDVDGFAGVGAAVRHLTQQGYRRVGFLGWPVGSQTGDDRRAGWLSETTALGIGDESLQAAAEQDVPTAAAAARPLLAELGRGGALVCASDTLAVGAWTVLRELGLSAGSDVGLVGFDDTDVARSFGISSVQQPLALVAATLLDMAAEHRGPDGATGPGVVLQPRVVERSSSTRHVPLPPAHSSGGTA